MDDRGNFGWFLGMQISEGSENITFERETYIESVREFQHARQ